MRLAPKHAYFAAFTAVFAVLAAFVFWGTWSLDVAPVMPDDNLVHPLSWAENWDAVVRKFLSSGKFIPSDVLWDGLFVSPYFCQELKYAVALYCAGLGLAYFLRGRGLSRLASYGAGILLSFCGYWASLFSAGHGGWFIWMTYGVFAFGLADRAVRRGKLKNWLLLGACVAWGSFYQPDLWLLFTTLTGFYFAWCCVRERRFPWKGMSLAAAVFFAIGAPSFRSALVNDLAGRDRQIADGETVVNGSAQTDAEKRWIFATNWSLPPMESVEFFIARLNGDTSCPLTLSIGSRHGTGVRPYTGALGRPKDAAQGNYRQHSLYVGFVTCLLALAGVVLGWRLRTGREALCRGETETGRRTPDVLFFSLAAVVFYLFSLGRHCESVYRLVYALPFGDYLRAPVKWHHLTEFSLCVLAGFGLEGLLSLAWLRGRRGLGLVVALVLVGAADLARIDRLYCAPVDLRRVRQTNSEMQMNVLRREDFANPQIAEMVRGGRIVSLANYLGNPDLYLVEILTPRSTKKDPSPPLSVATGLGILSLVGTLLTLGCALSVRTKDEPVCGT